MFSLALCSLWLHRAVCCLDLVWTVLGRVAPGRPPPVSAWISSWQEWRRASQGHLSALSKTYRLQQDLPYIIASPPEPDSVVIFACAWPVLMTFLLKVTRSYWFWIVLSSVFVPPAPAIAYLRIFPLFLPKAKFWGCFLEVWLGIFFSFLVFFTFSASFECFLGCSVLQVATGSPWMVVHTAVPTLVSVASCSLA